MAKSTNIEDVSYLVTLIIASIINTILWLSTPQIFTIHIPISLILFALGIKA